MRLAAGALLLAAAVRPAAAQGPAPIVTVLDSGGNVGRYNDVALRSDGRGVIAYTDTTNGRVKLALCADAACTSAALKAIDFFGSFSDVAVAVDGLDRPVVAYQDSALGAIRVATCNDPGCSLATAVTIANPQGFVPGTGLVIGRDGRPLVAYVDFTENALKVVHCDDETCFQHTTTTYTVEEFTGPLSSCTAALGSDGLPVVVTQHWADLRVAHCVDAACTAATFASLPGDPSPPFTSVHSGASLAVGSDGRMIASYLHVQQLNLPPQPAVFGIELARCADVACSALTPVAGIAASHNASSAGTAPGNRPVVAHFGASPLPDGHLWLRRCGDANCAAAGGSDVLVDGPGAGGFHALATDPLGNALLSYYDAASGDLKVAYVGAPQELVAGDVSAFEGDAGVTSFFVPVTLTGGGAATVDFTTADGTATAPSDYAAASGTLTFAPGTSTLYVTVSVTAETAAEPDETFRVLLANAQGATIGDGEGLATILDDDGVRSLSISDQTVFEGDTGTTNLVFTVTLDGAAPAPVRVDFASADLTATAGVDYVPVSGALSFAPGQTTRVVTVSAIGDVLDEAHEAFHVLLSNPQGAVIADGEGLGTILDDDFAELPPPGELGHGDAYAGDLKAVLPGTVPDTDEFRFAQQPFASYEVVVDAVSGDAVPLTLERRDAGGVLQTGTPTGTGASVALRWRTAGTDVLTDETVRISGACAAFCEPHDVYRVRAYETTLRAARFNNSGTQATILLLQNPGDQPVTVAVSFWSAAGALVATYAPAAPLEPHGLLVLNTQTVAPLTSGSLTIAHTGGYGGLAGKAVAVEPATGFSFDTPLEPRRR